jgi:c-di-GMP-binding flagellar brake protein YcgR
MPESGGQQSRKYPRMSAEYVVAYRRPATDAADAPPQFAKTRSVGLGGMMFATEAPLAPGEPVAVELVAEGRTVAAQGQVVYVERAADGLYENGVAFTEIAEEDREHLLGCYLRQEYLIPE